jgi:hypothetical protein
MLHDEEGQELSVHITFHYYMTIEMILDADQSFGEELSPSGRDCLKQLINLWTPQKSDKALIPEKEASYFSKYFGLIEVNNRDELQTVIFPIPRMCRQQMNNALVKQEMTRLLDDVKR